jgi:putative addiction module component (TIGR02574 family)
VKLPREQQRPEGSRARIVPMSSAKSVLQDGLTLPPAERAGVALELIASLDGEPDQDVEEAWLAEAERRQREAADDPAAFEPWDELRTRILNRIRAPRP